MRQEETLLSSQALAGGFRDQSSHDASKVGLEEDIFLANFSYVLMVLPGGRAIVSSAGKTILKKQHLPLSLHLKIQNCR